MTKHLDKRRIGWELYRSYLGVLEEGSLSGAARSLDVTQPTVGRHIAALERALGLTLFTRSQQGLLPTEAALALRPYAEAMAHSAAALVRAAGSHGDGVKGTVRVTASETMGAEVLPTILARLQAEYPALEVELVLSNRVQDLLHREADIAVRMAEPRQEALVARRVGQVALGLHAHPDYLAAHGTPATLAELRGHRLVGFDAETPFLRAALKALPAGVRDGFAVRSDSDLAQLAFLRAGGGIGVCQVGLARRSTPPLVHLLPGEFRWALDAWVVMHEDLRASPRCRRTFDALLHGLQQYLEEAFTPTIAT